MTAIHATVPRRAAAQFVHGRERAQVAVVVVTYNSAQEVGPLVESLRAEAGSVPLRAVFVDNCSEDATMQLLSTLDDASVIRAPANIGYAGGINLALREIPDDEPVLVVNPDLEFLPGCVAALLSRMRASGAGVVAPRVLDRDGQVFRSLRREPTVPRALGDAVLGSRWLGRPAWLSEELGAHRAYRTARLVEWASGAALLIRPDVVRTVGPWDERFFLYSEETDLQRRVRDAGYDIWYEPGAAVRHRQGASGASRELIALMAVNRIRYREKHAGKLRTVPYRVAVILHELLRARSPEHRYALRAVLRRNSWRSLPHARPSPVSRLAPATGTIIIPAHDEERVIHRSLRSACELAETSVEVIVVCNGCSDQTAATARRFAALKPSLVVVELDAASKIAAFNAADAIASHESRVYLDADIAVTPEALREVLWQLAERGSDGSHVCDAARPPASVDTAESSGLIRAYYRARARLEGPRRALWGAGVYALNRSGRARFAHFPEVIADDVFVDQLIPAARRVIVDTTPVVVTAPRDARSLVSILRRGIRAKRDPGSADTTSSTARELIGTIRGPGSALDAVVFAGFAIAARWSARMGSEPASHALWERDVSTR